ncbi:ATP-binding cassette sub-family A member 17-like [Danaus plexippus]|uniref:ATP-binding cassette sub-family A member 17-like n=1 Tax=Danaus plexippus TaxID=13037 RepID=UPI002AB07040|nr:ATP-binding cassette sub-family A member 17-like [Danaus plexippus]
MTAEEVTKPIRSKFQRHTNALIWKSYLQRQRRWVLLCVETLLAVVLYLSAILIAKPVFLTPLQAIPQPPLTAADILASLNKKNILGYAPNVPPFNDIMNTVGDSLGTEIIRAPKEDDLNNILYNRSRGVPLNNPVIWILWKKTENNMWKFSIRSTERAQYVTGKKISSNPHLRSGILAVQLAISQAILQYASGTTPAYQLSLASMPVSPLMEHERVRKHISSILLCFTLALLPPVLETQSLVIHETSHKFKRALRIRGVDYSSMYIGWLTYFYLTALPICLLASITLILIFRWVHLLFTFILVLAYVSVMIMLALIMAMFHTQTKVAATWTTLFTLLQTFLAELIVHHGVDLKHEILTFFLHLIIPPLGLMHGFNEFALLQTGHEGRWEGNSLVYTILFWFIMIALYFGILMMLQRTLKAGAIGGQVSWKSIIFKSVEDVSKLHQIKNPTGREHEKLQEVNELAAKAISIRNMSKSIMGNSMLSNITLDIYRGEFTILYSEFIQSKMIQTLEDLLMGLTHPDEGSINILGEELTHGKTFVSVPHMLGYCHRKGCLVDDLTVQEHFTLYCSICLWNESTDYVSEYEHLRSIRLLVECELKTVCHEYVRNLGVFYQAQLCWAIAMLLEPRIIIIPSFGYESAFNSVMRDKIMQYKKYITVIKLCFTSILLEYADRVFIFDNKLLVFGGSPAYMFFKYGREYRVRLTLKSGSFSSDEDVNELLKRTTEAGATIRAHLGTLLILRLPAIPTATVAALVKDLSENSDKYEIVSMNISIPDSEEVCNRAIFESRANIHGSEEHHQRIKIALNHLAEAAPIKRQKSYVGNLTHLKYTWAKFVAYYRHYRLYFFVTILLAITSGIFIGLSLATVLGEIERDRATKAILHGEVLTVEALEQKTNLILRADSSSESKSVVNAYVFSETMATEKQIENMFYTALSAPESITEYLVTRAIDSPQQYVFLYAYGLDVAEVNGSLRVRVLYSPLHTDHSAAPRALARAFMALLRHYTSALDATIEVTDDPLALDLTTYMKQVAVPPILIQFLLILTITHITLIPSKEHGFIRHMQSHAKDFSPARYWLTLFICDLVLCLFLVILMTVAMIVVMVFVAPMTFRYRDLAVVPTMLIIYCVGCIPQAYLFSLGPNAALNAMTFVMINLLFSETTVFAKLLYGNALNYALNFISVSPQFNIAIAFVKIEKVFLYNSECIVFKRKNLCSSKTLHKCCQKCGILQKCFSKRSYLSQRNGVVMEAFAMLSIAFFLMILLLLWEYKYIQRIFRFILYKWIYPNKEPRETETMGVRQERNNVVNMKKQLKKKIPKNKKQVETYLLAHNISQRHYEKSIIRNVYLSLSKGEVLAISGVLEHGRLRLCEILAGFQLPTDGQLWCLSKWTLLRNPHLFSQQTSLSCEHNPLPGWMSVRNGLEMLAVLRGVPRSQALDLVMDYVNAMELYHQADRQICYLKAKDVARLHFAAAVIGAPEVVILEESTEYQKYSVRRAMYHILNNLRQRGHSIIISSSSVETLLPVSNRLAILVNGRIYDIDQLDKLVERHSEKGYTVVVQLKYKTNVTKIFVRYFTKFIINDSSEELVNFQLLDEDLTYASVFEKMEILQEENDAVNSYIVSATPIDYIYNSIISQEGGHIAEDQESRLSKYLFRHRKQITPPKTVLNKLIPFETRFHLTKLKELPWSVIFDK